LINRAIALTGLGKTEEALSAYKSALEASPDNLELRYEYAQLLAANKQGEQAIAELKRVAKSEDPAIVGAAANLLGRLKAFDACTQALDSALAKKPVADLHVRRGVCRHGANDDKGAEADYQAALGVDASFAPAHYYLGMHYLSLKQKKKAKAALEKASELGGDSGVGKAAKKELKGL
jgi:tetratricopeptide (TPR) repeat protein